MWVIVRQPQNRVENPNRNIVKVYLFHIDQNENQWYCKNNAT